MLYTSWHFKTQQREPKEVIMAECIAKCWMNECCCAVDDAYCICRRFVGSAEHWRYEASNGTHSSDSELFKVREAIYVIGRSRWPFGETDRDRSYTSLVWAYTFCHGQVVESKLLMPSHREGVFRLSPQMSQREPKFGLTFHAPNPLEPSHSLRSAFRPLWLFLTFSGLSNTFNRPTENKDEAAHRTGRFHRRHCYCTAIRRESMSSAQCQARSWRNGMRTDCSST